MEQMYRTDGQITQICRSNFKTLKISQKWFTYQIFFWVGAGGTALYYNDRLTKTNNTL